MESFDDFMELFRRRKKERNDRDLSNILKTGPKYFQNLSTSDIGLVLSILLNDKTGLLHLLENASDKDMTDSITGGFKLLKFIITEFRCLLNKYINGMKKVCESAIITCSGNLKTAAVHCFKSLLQMCPISEELRLDETVQAFLEAFDSCNDKDGGDRAKILDALGSVAKYQPLAISSDNFNGIFEILRNTFDDVIPPMFQPAEQKNDLKTQKMKKYFNVLNDLLTLNFSPQNVDETSQFYQKLYGCIKKFSDIDLNQKYKYASREAIALLGSHMTLFVDYIYQDALFWPDILLKWTNLPDIEYRKVAFNASSVYYKTMGEILERDRTESNRKIFENLMQRFEKDFTTDKVNPTTLRLSICGLGHMAGPCKTYLSEEKIANKFSLIAQRIFIMYPSDDETRFFLENFAYYQVTLSQLLMQMSDVSMHQLAAISTLASVLIKRFPDLPVTSHPLVVTSLMKTIANISKVCSRRLRREFIEQLVYEGVIWSCSHTLFIDAEREREVKHLDERPVCYKNYLPLWQALVCPNDVTCDIKIEIFTNMIESCVKLFKKLNLDVKIPDRSDEIETSDIPAAVNDTDLKVFINLVDLNVAILEEIKPAFMKSKMNWFLCELIRESNRHPLMSGFYKLIRVVLKLYNLSSDENGQKLLGDTHRLLTPYLLVTIERLDSFSGELQASCLAMVLEMPVSIAENMLNRLVSTFKTAFSLGQSNFNLAQSALNALEKCTKKTEEEETKKFLIEVVPSLESLLQSSESTVELTLPAERKVIKNIVLTDHEKTLPGFQRRILLFFGSLNSEITLKFSAQRSFENNEVLRDDRNLLEYTLLYKDIRPDVYLDKILPRTIALALNSTDRRTRVVACEVLHSIVIVMLGRRRELLASNPDHLLPMFKKICPAILRLGSDSDQVIQQLFSPLMIQLTHWYSSSTMCKSLETGSLIEILFDSLTYESNMALSDFCGVCLAEFVKWSIKQSPDDLELTNAAAVIEKITNLAVHPSAQKRIGAAVAFNYLYTILRKSDVLVDVFCLELLFGFIKGLDGCSSPQILESLNHIERLFDDKHELLKTQSSKRRVPVEFKSTSLKDAADWLIAQCGSLDRNCRSKCMEVLKVICKHVPPFGSVEKVFANYVSERGVPNLTKKIILEDLLPETKTRSVETMKRLLRMLDYYVWILDGDMLSLDLLFMDKNTQKDVIFNCVIKFVHLANLKTEISENSSEFTKQYQEHCVLKCQIISQIFNFVKILLNKMVTQAGRNSSSYIPKFFWDDEMYSLMSKCIFEPEVFGFRLQNSEIIEALPSSVIQLLDTLMQKLDSKNLSLLRDSIAKKIENIRHKFNLNRVFMNESGVASKNYLKGLTMLQASDHFDGLYEELLGNDYDSSNKVMEIFELLKGEEDGQFVSINLESSKKEYMENLLEFLCLKFEGNMVKTFVNIVESKTKLNTLQDSAIIFHGEYFVNLFGATVFRYILKHISKSMEILLSDALKDKFDTALIILEDLLTYVKKNKKISEEFLSALETEFVNRFSTLHRLTDHVAKREESVINLYSILIELSKNPSMICREPNKLYSWIIQELSDSSDLEYKTRMLNNFLPCIVDEIAHKNQGLENCFRGLKTDYDSMSIKNLVRGSLEHSNVIASFQTLARHLPALKSVTFFHRVIHLTIGTVEYLWDNNSTAYLTAYFNEISSDDSRRSLQILYDYFMTTEDVETRLKILNKLLLKCLHSCKTNDIEHFFEKNIRQICQIVSETDLGIFLVSKIGCYNLIEIMFAKVPLETLTNPGNRIVNNAIGTTKTEKEFCEALYYNVVGVRKLKPDDTVSKELIRLLHCAAFNCLIAIVSWTNEDHLYVIPFAEESSKGQLVWENIIDTNRRYEFEQTFEETPKEYKKVINIRKRSEPKRTPSCSERESYNISGSTINEDMRCSDSHKSNFRSQSIGENIANEELMSLTFESDDLNDHECMGSICGIITHMVSMNIFNSGTDVENCTMPGWMKQFHSSLNARLDDKTLYNVKLFMVKIIVNVQEVFKPYVKFFLAPVLFFLNSHFRKYKHISYVIKDILVMLIDWDSEAILSQKDEKQLAQMLLEGLIENGDSEQRNVHKVNVEIINGLVGAWGSCLEVPQGILTMGNASSKFKVCMILIFLSNDKFESLVPRSEVLEYLVTLLEDSTLKEEVVLLVCDALGLFLKFLELKKDYERNKRITDSILASVVMRKSIKYPNKYIKYIHEIHQSYPNIIHYCFDESKRNFSKVDDPNNKAKFLEMFVSFLPDHLKEPRKEQEILTVLGCIKFYDVLNNKISECQNVSLKLIKKLLNTLSPSDYLQWIKLIDPYSKDNPIALRKLILDIFMAVHKKYSQRIDEDDAISELKDLSKRILLMGLLDTNECLQKEVVDFWTEEGNLADTSIERMLQIFEMYDSKLDATYLPILPLMMLDLVRQNAAFDKKIFECLMNCEFRDHRVEILCSSKEVGLVAPPFRSYFASQISQRYSRSNSTFAHSNQFVLSPVDAIVNEFSDSTETVKKIPEPSKNRKSARLLNDAAKIRDAMRHTQIAENLRRKKILGEKVDRERNSIKIYRRYRIGDFPDTEITHSSLIEPLQQLAKYDQVIARDLTVAICCSMLEKMSPSQSKRLSDSLKYILDNTKGSKPLIAAVLEIILKSKEIYVDPNVIARVSKSCGLLSLGALLLEEKMISGHTIEDSEPLAKTRKRENQYPKGNDWLQLANIYKSMNDDDIVRIIFGSEKFGKELQEASSAQAASKWSTARVAYEKAFKNTEGLVKNYCQESLFTCLAHLSDWKQIDDHVKADLNGDFNALWHKPVNDNWLTAWALQAQIHEMVRNDHGDQFLKALNNPVHTKETLSHLKLLYGGEMAIFHVDQDPEFAENCLTSGLEKIRIEWKHSNPLYYEEKINKYPKLCGLSDIKMYLRGIKENEDRLIPNVERMLTSWNNSVPANQDNLLLWDKHIAYRLYLVRSLKQKFEVAISNGTNGIANMLNAAVVKQCLNMAQAAFDQCNPHFMDKFLQYLDPYLQDDDSLIKERRLAFAKYKYLCYFDSEAQAERCEAFIASWEESHNLVKTNSVDTKVQIDVRQHIGSLASELQNLVYKSDPIERVLLEHPSISKQLPCRKDRVSTFKQLSDYCLSNLKECYESKVSEDKADCYLKVSKYCHSMSSDFDTGLDLSEEFIHSTLGAMRYGSLEATQYFPCLLHLDYSKNPKLEEKFECTSAEVETWMFLKWQAQLLSHIGTPISSLIAPILSRLARTYPDPFVYAFRMTKEMNKSLSTDPTVRKLNEILQENNDLKHFLKAMKYVVQPELLLTYYLNELGLNMAQNPVAGRNTLLAHVYPDARPDGKNPYLQGCAYTNIAIFKGRIKDGTKRIDQMIDELKKVLKIRIQNVSELPLKAYSPWLDRFRGGNIEVPGQYTGDKKPMPQYHAKIVKLNPTVRILPSMRKPIKITMLGNDGKSYSFLVKFGEDLRTDERIEQVFMLMNRILQGDAACRQPRQLSIDTYLVVPITGSLGLIKWIENTKSLNEIIKSVLTEQQENSRRYIQKSYVNWIEQANPGGSANYETATIEYDSEKVTKKFNELKKGIKRDVLREAFKSVSSSPESFFAIRQNFITSYATMCIAQWILGIGDRNLENTLISYASGKVLGIDFGYSFDSSIDVCSVPELTPFRLTPKILMLLEPFDENGLLKITMINVFRALKRGKDPLLACMDIFIKEPLLDWLPKRRAHQGQQESSDVKWYPKKKINIVKSKFNGVKPSHLTLQQLEARYGNTPYFQKCIDIVNGSDRDHPRVRSKYKNENLSTEEQIECLLDQATDPNILGRAYAGWQAWI